MSDKKVPGYKASFYTQRPDDFEVLLSIEGDAEILDDLDIVLDALKERGYKPGVRASNGSKGGSKWGGHKKEGSSDGGSERKPCPVHEGVSLFKNWSEKKQKFWWGHKKDDGSYCFGRPS